MTSPRSTDAGFTLVEVLVSMFIFALISVGALIALSSTLDARERAQARIDEVEALAAARRLMADDFAAMTPRQDRDGLGGFVDPRLDFLAEGRLELTRRGRPNPDGTFARGDLLRVSWRVENGQLVRSFLPHENPAYVQPPLDRIVLDGVEQMTVIPLIFNPGSANTQISLFRADAMVVSLTHEDGSTTQHIFEIPDA